MAQDLETQLRSLAAPWREIIGRTSYFELPIEKDNPTSSAKYHAAQTLNNLEFVLSQLKHKTDAANRDLVTLESKITTMTPAEVDGVTSDSLAYQIANLLGQIADNVGRGLGSSDHRNLCERLANDSVTRISMIETFYAHLDDEDSR